MRTATGRQVVLHRARMCPLCRCSIFPHGGSVKAYAVRVTVEGVRQTVYLHLSCGDRLIDREKSAALAAQAEGDETMTATEKAAAVRAAKKAKPDPEKVRDLERRLAELRSKKEASK